MRRRLEAEPCLHSLSWRLAPLVSRHGGRGMSVAEPNQHDFPIRRSPFSAKGHCANPEPEAGPHLDGLRQRVQRGSRRGRLLRGPTSSERHPSFTSLRWLASKGSASRGFVAGADGDRAQARSLDLNTGTACSGSVMRMTSALHGPTCVVCDPAVLCRPAPPDALKRPLARSPIDEHPLSQAVQLDIHDLRHQPALGYGRQGGTAGHGAGRSRAQAPRTAWTAAPARSFRVTRRSFSTLRASRVVATLSAEASARR